MYQSFKEIPVFKAKLSDFKDEAKEMSKKFVMEMEAKAKAERIAWL